MNISCHRSFLPGTALEPAVIPTAQASHCSTFRIMCDVPSIAVFCNESIECFPGRASKFFLKLLVTIPVAPIIIGIIVHFRFHIRCISIHKLLYFNLLQRSTVFTVVQRLRLISFNNKGEKQRTKRITRYVKNWNT